VPAASERPATIIGNDGRSTYAKRPALRRVHELEAEISRTIGAVDIFALEQAAEAILEAVRQMRIALETS
jgi:hypothetical protein